MSLPNKQIGWSQESNLLWEILKELNGLEGTMGMLTDVVPSSRTLTINGVSQDLSADRTWTILGTAIGVVPSFSFLPAAPTVPGEFYWAENSEGTQWLPGAFGGTYYNAGLYYSNGIEWTYMETPYQAIQAEVDAGINFNKFVTPLTFNNAAKWNTKQNTLTLTTSGSGGPATLIGDVLNIPIYTGGGGGGQTENFNWRFDTSTAAGDPGNGKFRANNATASLVTQLYVDSLCADTGLNIDNIFAAINGNWSIYVQQENDSTKFAQYTTVGPYTNNGGWWTIPVTYVQSGVGGALTNNTKCVFYFTNKNYTVIDAVPIDGSNNAVSSNGVFDALALKADDTNVLHKTGNESWTGTKSSTVTAIPAISVSVTAGGFGINGIVSNSSTSGSGFASASSGPGGSGLYVASSSSGTGIRIDHTGNNQGIQLNNNSSGTGYYVANNNIGTGSYVINASTGLGLRIENTTAATGKPFQYTKNAVERAFLNDAGQWNAQAFIKTGATATNILLAGGTDIPQSTFVPATRTININGVSFDLSADRSWRASLSNTGALTYAGATQASATTINVGAVTGIITDNETTPGTPSYVTINYAGQAGVTVPTIAGGPGTYVLLDKGIVTGGVGAGALVFQNTYPTSAQRKSMIYLSKISHPDLANIAFVLDEVDFVTSPLQQFRDLFQVIQYMNQGVTASGNAGLTINTAAGNILGDGINFVANRANPNMIAIASGAPRNFLLLNRSGAAGGFVTAIDPLNYDVAGVTTPVGGGTNNSTIQYLYYAPGVGFAIQRGQTVYPTLVDAVSAVGREAFVLRPNLINNSILIAAICLRHTTTNMNDTAFCRILPADKFGQIGGAASGIAVSTFQTIYGNSIIPQLTTTTLLGAVTYRRGSAVDTDNVFVIQNGAGTGTFSVTGAGNITANSFIKTGGTSDQFLMGNGSVAADIHDWPSGTVGIGFPADTGNGDTLEVNGSIAADVFRTPTGTGGQALLANGTTASFSIKITTAVSISATTFGVDSISGTNSQSQTGRNVIIANGASAINYTINTPVTLSILKTGSAAITFVAGAGRSIVQMSGTLVMNGIAGSTAAIISDGTVDYLYITNY